MTYIVLSSASKPPAGHTGPVQEGPGNDMSTIIKQPVEGHGGKRES